MWVYKEETMKFVDGKYKIMSEPFYEVGYWLIYGPHSSEFKAMETYGTKAMAREAVHYLNGGN